MPSQAALLQPRLNSVLKSGLPHCGPFAEARVPSLGRASDASRAASVLIARAENLRDPQGGREDGGSGGENFWWALPPVSRDVLLRGPHVTARRSAANNKNLPVSRPPILPVKS